MVRVLAGLLSVVFLVTACGILYVRSLLGNVRHEVYHGNESLTFSEVYNDVSFSDIPDSVEDLQDSREQYAAIQSVELLQADYIQNILLIGSDTRDPNLPGNSDTMMILSINRKTKQINLISLMRAMYVRIPKQSGPEWGMLNAALTWGGPELLAKTIENNFRIRIDDYALVDFSGFVRLVDLVGGMNIALDENEVNYLNRYAGGDYTPGMCHLTGIKALNYARMRKSSLTDNDFKRTARQRKVIEILLQKAFRMNLSQLNDFAAEALSSVNTSLSDGEILSLAGIVPDYSSYTIRQMMLPVENESGDTYIGIMHVDGMEVYKVDYYTNVTALRKLIMGETVTVPGLSSSSSSSFYSYSSSGSDSSFYSHSSGFYSSHSSAYSYSASSTSGWN